MTARQYDTNGWFEIKRNPLSKVGIYDYSGAQIGAPPADASKIFRVYRPATELADPETLASFKLVPLIDDHTMIGEGFTAPETKGIAGVIGEDVYFEGDTLYGNPKIYSKSLAQKIKNGKTELSCGYRCRYDFTPGEWNGQQYDVVQRRLRGNHVALVDEGRMGPEVSILDHKMVITVDAKETTPVDDELKAVLAAIVARLDKLEAPAAAPDPKTPPAALPVAKDGDAPTEQAPTIPDPKAAPTPPPAKDDDETVEGEPASMDAALKTIASLKGKIAALETRPAMDEATIVGQLAKKTDLVAKLGPLVGVFDHSSMTVAQVAAYGVEKLKIHTAKGSELVALDAYLQAKAEAPKAPTTIATQDESIKQLAGKIAAHTTGA